jgi:hypothetical protein
LSREIKWYFLVSIAMAAKILSLSGLGTILLTISALAGEEAPGPDHFRIPLMVSGADESGDVPLFAGVPFPKTWKAGPVHVVDSEGRAVPSSARIMVRWPESDAPRWVGVDFVGRPGREYFVVPGPGQAAAPAELKVEPAEGGWSVTTGPARFELGPNGTLIHRAWFDANRDGNFADAELALLNAKGDDLYVIDQNGLEGLAGLDTTEGQWRYETGEEERGGDQPLLRAVFRREGWYVSATGEKMARHVTRLHFYAGSPAMKIEHRLVISGDTGKRWFREYGVRLRYANAPDRVTMPGGDKPGAEVVETPFEAGDREVFLFQEKAFYMNRMDPANDCRFEMGKILADGSSSILKTGSFAGNWMFAAGRKNGVGAVLRNFWQTYPKEMASSAEAMTLRLWAPRAGAEMDFRPKSVMERWPKEWYNEDYASKTLMDRLRKLDTEATGFSRSHEIVVLLTPPDAVKEVEKVAARTQTPAVALAGPEWLRYTEAMGQFHPRDPERFPDEEAFIEAWFDQHMSVWRQWGDYGFFEFGHWPHVWYRKAAKGPLEGKWYPYPERYSAGIDYGFSTSVWRAFARSGQRKYFDAAEETSRQRLDMGMVHWDGLEPEEPLKFGRWNGLPRRLRGTYTIPNAPVIWAGNSMFHHNSGTDIRSLAWLYYLTDHRDAREMLEWYGEAVKRVLKSGNLTPFRGTRPFATLRNLGTVWQETGDPEIKKFMGEQVAWLADLKAPQGVGFDRESTGLAKYSVKAAAMERVYDVAGDELAGKSLLRGATTRATTMMGEGPFSYANVEGEQLSAAYRMTGDPLFVRALQRDMAVAVSEYRNPETGEWLSMWDGLGPSASTNVYPLGGMAYAMDAIVRAEKADGGRVPLTPYLRQSGYGPRALALLEKPHGEEVGLDLRSNKPLDPVILDAKGNKVGKVSRTSWVDQLYSLETGPTRWEVKLPASLPAGIYLIESGGEGALWEVTWTNAPRLALYAPEGLILGPGGRQWGNRIMTGDRDHPAPAYFLVPEDCSEFQLTVSAPCRVELPGGSAQVLARGLHTIAVPEGQRGKLCKIESPSVNLIQLRGVPPVFAYGEASRYLAPHEVKEGLAKWDQSRTKPEAKIEEEGAFVKTPGSFPGGGILLKGKRRVVIPSEGLIRREEGTVEFWICPQWNSAEQFLQNSLRTIMDGEAWQVVLHRYGEMSVTATAQPGIETNAGAFLKKNIWTHIALQWRREKGAFRWELFVDGKKQTFGIDHAGMAAVARDFVPAAPAQKLFFGGNRNGRQDLDALLGGLRFSRIMRYQGDFDPAASLKSDTETLGLFLFENGKMGAAELLNF